MMHKLLSRLVRRNLPKDIEPAQIQPLLDAVTVSFEQHDQDRIMLERSLMLMSDELNDINSKLTTQLAEVELYQQQLEKSLVEQTAIMNATTEAIFSVKPSGLINQINISGCHFFGKSESEIRISNQKYGFDILLEKFTDSDQFYNLIGQINNNTFLKAKDCFATKDNKYYECYTVPEILDGKCVGRAWCFRDITDSRLSQERLRHQAFHDALTGLPNRLLLLETIDRAVAVAKRNDTKVAVLFIDLDDFKKINDTAGHDEGDRFLIDVSTRVQSVLRDSDVIGRLGGDEFLIILENVESQHQIINMHERILKLFSTPYQAEENQYVVSCSIGISFYPQDGNNSEELIRKADMAMYEAKRGGKNTYHYFDPSLERVATRRVTIETQLRSAIDDNKLVLHYQPKVDLQSNKIVGTEALVRWINTDGELIYPDSFIPLAEEAGLIRDLTLWVVERVFQQRRDWKNTLLESIPVSINISATDFSDPQFLNNITQLLDTYQIDPTLIEFELTESIFSIANNHVQATVTGIKAKGIALSIDDFGTGYSSLSYLHDLDIDYLKIDKRFVHSLETSDKSKAIVKSIIGLGINLGVKVVAEGVETENEHQLLVSNGCHIAQGYFYTRPQLSEDLLRAI